MSRGNLLMELQTADDHVTTLRRHVAALEASLAGDPEVERVRRAQGRAHDATVHAQAAVRAAELELGAVKARADALHRKLYGGSVRNASELITLQHEYDGVAAGLSPLEDAVLERMEEAESRAAAEHAVAAELAELEGRRATAAGPDTERLAELHAGLARAVRERDEVLLAMAPGDAALYQRLARRLRPAVAHVVNNSCGGCRMPLGIQEARSARSAEAIAQCSSCDRILVS